jgi:hypothetical protein
MQMASSERVIILTFVPCLVQVRVLTDLGLFTEALTVLMRLLHGDRLPHTGDSSFRQTESKLPSAKFNTTLPVTDMNNLKV